MAGPGLPVLRPPQAASSHLPLPPLTSSPPRGPSGPGHGPPRTWEPLSRRGGLMVPSLTGRVRAGEGLILLLLNCLCLVFGDECFRSWEKYYMRSRWKTFIWETRASVSVSWHCHKNTHAFINTLWWFLVWPVLGQMCLMVTQKPGSAQLRSAWNKRMRQILYKSKTKHTAPFLLLHQLQTSKKPRTLAFLLNI